MQSRLIHTTCASALRTVPWRMVGVRGPFAIMVVRGVKVAVCVNTVTHIPEPNHIVWVKSNVLRCDLGVCLRWRTRML